MLMGNAIGIGFTTIRGYEGVDIVLPALRSIEVGDVADDVIVLLYDERLDESSVPAITDYSLSGTSETVSSIVISNRTVFLTLTGDINYDDTVLLSYTAGANPISDTSTNDAVNLVNESVVNNIVIQYIEYINSLIVTPASTVYTDGITSVRKKIATLVYQVDVTLTVIGFAGVEDTDWAWVLKYNGTTGVFRSGVRGGNFVVDNTLDGTGFAGAEDVNWEQLTSAAGGGVQTTYRDGVRDGAYVIDKALDGTGFAGTEDVNWENIRKYKPI